MLEAMLLSVFVHLAAWAFLAYLYEREPLDVEA